MNSQTRMQGELIRNNYKTDITDGVEGKKIVEMKFTNSNNNRGTAAYQKIVLSSDSTLSTNADAKGYVAIDGIYTPNIDGADNLATSKKYVDDKISASDLGLNWKNAVQVRTTKKLHGTFQTIEGKAGIEGLAFGKIGDDGVIDGYTVQVNDRILVMNEGGDEAEIIENPLLEGHRFNGIYKVVSTGAVDFDGASETQKIVITGASGNFTISIGGETTASISAVATAAELKAALIELGSFHADTTVTYSLGNSAGTVAGNNTITIVFGDIGPKDQITFSGDSATAVITTFEEGQSATEDGKYQLVRTDDADSIEGASDIRRAAVFVDQGTIYGGRGYVESGNPPIAQLSTDGDDGDEVKFFLMATISEIDASDGLGMNGRKIKVNVDESTIGIESDQLQVKNGGITSSKLAAGAVETTNIDNEAVTHAKLKKGDTDGAVATDVIRDEAITSSKLATGAVNTVNIATGAVTDQKIAADAVNAVNIATGAVTNQKIAANAVNTVNIANQVITHAKLSTTETTVTDENGLSSKVGAAVKTLNIVDANVTHAKIAPNAVDAVNIATGAVTNQKIAADAVNAVNIVDGAVTNQKIAANAVQNTNIDDGAVTLDKLDSNSVDNTKLKVNAVKTSKITDEAVTNDKLATTSTTEIVDGESRLTGAAVKTNNIVDRNITHVKIAVGAVQNTNIADGAVTDQKIAADAVNAVNIATGAVTNQKIAANAVQTTNIVDFNVTHAKLSTVDNGGAAVFTDNIEDGNITNLKIGNNAVQATNIADGAVTHAKLEKGNTNGAVATDVIRNEAITTDKIKDKNVTTDKIADGNITNSKIANNTITHDKTSFSQLNITGTLFAEAVVVGGTSDSGGTMNLAKVKSKSLLIDVPTPARGGDQPWVHPTPAKQSLLETAGTDGEHAQGWTIPATAANGFLDTITHASTSDSNGVIGGTAGILTYSQTDNVKGTLIMWSVNVRSSGQDPVSVTAKTFVQLQDGSGNLTGDPIESDIQVLHTDVTDVGQAIAETILTSQSTYIATSNQFIREIWVEISHVRSTQYSKAIVPNGSYFNIISLIVSDGSISDSSDTYSTPYVELYPDTDDEE